VLARRAWNFAELS